MIADKLHRGTSDLNNYYEEEDEDDTLSLCDLPIHGDLNADEWSGHCFLGQHQIQTSPNPDQDLFEFSVEDLSSFSKAPKDIIFCGKIIPFDRPTLKLEKPTKPQKQSSEQSPRRRRKRLFRSFFFRWGISSSKFQTKWNLFVLGLTRFPTEMGLSDMKTRQSRLKTPSTMFGSSSSKNGSEVVKKTIGSSGCSDRHGNGGLRIITSLACIPLL